MRKYLFLFICSFFAIGAFAQERLFTDKEHGGAENGIFGKINDEINVSPTGQLSYEIPIPALPGTGGMKPRMVRRCARRQYAPWLYDGCCIWNRRVWYKQNDNV